MKDTKLNATNKKNAGKGNGNTVIDNHENVSGYSFPPSFGENSDANTQNKTKKQQ